MRKTDFDFHLPPELIAQQPLEPRTAARLLCIDRAGALDSWRDRHVHELPALLRAGDLLVFNDTRVLHARLLGRKATGGKVEALIERIVTPTRALAQLRANKPPRAGEALHFADVVATVRGRADEFFELDFGALAVTAVLDRIGLLPLPPYIERAATGADAKRYQTVFARAPGAVAAPTAGLHFDRALLAALAAAGIGRTYITLHVGAGTFQPLRTGDLRAHRMHREWLEVTPAACAEIAAARAAGGRIVAVGTTVVRALETAAAGGALAPYSGETEIFIYPGYAFRVIDGLLTNFHLPQSSLLMLVAAFAGTDRVLAAYRHAVAARYRFFSYGDAMLLL